MSKTPQNPRYLYGSQHAPSISAEVMNQQINNDSEVLFDTSPGYPPPHLFEDIMSSRDSERLTRQWLDLVKSVDQIAGGQYDRDRFIILDPYTSPPTK